MLKNAEMTKLMLISTHFANLNIKYKELAAYTDSEVQAVCQTLSEAILSIIQ